LVLRPLALDCLLLAAVERGLLAKQSRHGRRDEGDNHILLDVLADRCWLSDAQAQSPQAGQYLCHVVPFYGKRDFAAVLVGLFHLNGRVLVEAAHQPDQEAGGPARRVSCWLAIQTQRLLLIFVLLGCEEESGYFLMQVYLVFVCRTWMHINFELLCRDGAG